MKTYKIVPLALAALLGYGCSKEAQTPRKNLDNQISRPQITQQYSSLDSLVGEVAKMSGVDRGEFIAKHATYHTETFPFDGYRGGNYIVVKNTKNNDLYFFSQRGGYIGKAWRANESHTWFSQEHGSNVVRKFRWVDAVEVIREDYALENGNILRALGDSKGPFPVYHVQNGKLIKDKKPYRGTFGGDGEHYLDDRSKGFYFVVEEIVFDKNEKPLEEHGEFFVNAGGLLGNTRHINVRRKLPSNKLLPINDESAKDNGYMKSYVSIVPKVLR